MSIKNWPGGRISSTPPTPSGPFQFSTASGVWTLDQVAYWRSQNQWPTAGNVPTDPDFEYVTMLLHGDGTNGAQNNTFLDSSTNNFTITRNGNTTQGSFSPYGPNWSNYFNGSSTIVTPTSTALSFGTGDFSVEAWINYTSGNSIISNYTQLASPGDYGTLIEWNGGNIRGTLKADNSTVLTLTSSTSATVGSWNHVAFVRTGTTVSLYLNGVRVATGTSGINSVTNQFRVGGPYVNNTTADFTGYVSNLRVCKGTTPYAASATSISVSTQPLTVVSGTSLLTCADNRFIDDSTNNFAITATGTPSVQRFSPFAPTAAYSTATIGGSGYFDGAGDYLSLSTTSVGNFGTGDFTVEYWIAPITQGQLNHLDFRGTGGTGGAFRIGMVSAGFKIAAGWDSNDNQLTSTTTPNLSSWTHVAVTRSGTTCRMFINGIQEASVTSGYSFPDNGLLIATYTGSTAFFNGYMSNIRVVKGTALYTSSFTPPTAPLTAITNTSLLLNMVNGAIFDNAMMNDLETVGNAQISTSVVKFGTGSMYNPADTNGAGIRARASGVGTIDGNFTIEWWAYHSNLNTGSNHVMLGPWGISSSPLLVRVDNGSMFQIYMANASRLSISVASSGITAATWQHYAITRSGSTCYAFVSGIQVGTWTMSNSLNFETVSILSENAGTSLIADQMPGYIDDLRITKGVARYTANFTPPTAAFPDI